MDAPLIHILDSRSLSFGATFGILIVSGQQILQEREFGLKIVIQQNYVSSHVISVICAAGQMFNGSSCVACPIGSYQPLEGSTNCTSCLEFETTEGKGSTYRSQCTYSEKIFIRIIWPDAKNPLH